MSGVLETKSEASVASTDPTRAEGYWGAAAPWPGTKAREAIPTCYRDQAESFVFPTGVLPAEAR